MTMSGAGYLKKRVLPGCANEASSQMKCRRGSQMARSAAMFAGFVLTVVAAHGTMAAATPATRRPGSHRATPARSRGRSRSLPATSVLARRTCLGSASRSCGPAGQAIGNGFPTCIAPAIGKVTSQGTEWTFDLDVAGYHGVAPFGYGGTGIRGSSCSWSRRPGGSTPPSLMARCSSYRRTHCRRNSAARLLSHGRSPTTRTRGASSSDRWSRMTPTAASWGTTNSRNPRHSFNSSQ